MAEQYVLSNYPLSRPYQAALRQRVGEFDTLVVSELRQRSMGALVSRLAATSGRAVFVAIEDESSVALLPILELLATMTRADDLYRVDQRLRPVPFGRFESVMSGVRIVRESIIAMAALRRARDELALLAAADRVVVRRVGRRVAYINCNLWFGVKAGGSVGHISGVANAIMDKGHELSLFNAGGRLLVDERAEYVELAAPVLLALPFETNLYRFDRSCGQQIGAHMERGDWNFIYQRMSVGNYTGVRLSRAFGVPLVLEYNGSEAWVAKNWGRPLRYHDDAVAAEDVALRHAHVVVAVSDVLGDELHARGVERERIVVYPNCIDPSVFDPARFADADNQSLRASLGLRPDDVVASFIGTFGQWHGVDVLAKAIRHMLEHEVAWLERTGLRFVLIGDGMRMPEVKEILDHPLRDRFVVLTGLVPQLEAPRYLAMSDILLSPHVANADGSRFFGSPTKLFEYMAMGKGIVASDLDQIGDVLRDSLRLEALPADAPATDSSQLAVLVAPGSVQQLVEGIRFLAERPEWRQALGDNARRCALENYTWRRHVEVILERLDARVGSGND